MIAYLILWGVTAAGLGISVVGLHLIYRALGSDLGLRSPRKEVITAVVCAAVQALVPLACLLLLGYIDVRVAPASALVPLVVYKVTHLLEMTKLEVALVVLGQQVVLWFVIFALGAMAWSAA